MHPRARSGGTFASRTVAVDWQHVSRTPNPVRLPIVGTKRLVLLAVFLLVLTAGCGSSVASRPAPSGHPSESSAAPPSSASTSVPMVPSSTVPTSTVPPASSTVVQITRGGQVMWQTGEALNDSYYCCFPPSPDGVDRSGSAGCSGSTANGVPGVYVNGRLDRKSTR